MTKTKRIIYALAMLAVFVATSFATAFLYPARTIGKANAAVGGTFTEVTEDYRSLAYDTDKFASSVMRLTDAAKKEEYITLIVKLDSETLADAAGDERVSEIVGSAAYNDAAKAIRNKQNKLLRAIKKAGISYGLEARYDTVFAGFAVEIKTEDFERAESLIDSYGATAIISEKYYVEQTESTDKINVTVNDVNVHEETGIFDSSDVDYDGEGVIVAVLDSGFDYTHTAFTDGRAMPSADKLAMTRSDVAGKIIETKAYAMDNSLTAADVYVSDKIPYAYDYADKDSDVYPLESEHGTHVASIIAGCDDVITGVAPKAQLALMKVFSDVDDGAKQSDILRAVDDSVTLGVDVINMSLGMNAGFAREDDKEATALLYDSVRDMGISLIAAASNAYNSTYGSEANGNLPLTSNPDSGSVGSPSTYDAALSVASISGVKTPYLLFDGNPVYFLDASNAAGKLYDFVDIMLKGNESATFQYVTVPGVGDTYSGIDVKGKIALVRRGSTTFEEKVAAAYRAGAVGVIIYNNLPGDIRMSVGNYLYDWGIGCVSMSQADGEKLAARQSGVLKLSKNYLAGPFMSDFSSWGPAPDLGIKPEITAHGGEIYAAVPGQGYDRLSGTSMASPNQAGVHALVRQHVLEHFDSLFPGLDKDSKAGRQAIAARTNQLLMSTTDIAYNEYGNPYSVRKQGAGLANLLNAVSTEGFITVKDEDGEELDRTKLELGDDPEKTGVYTLEFTVNNTSSTSATYDVSALTYTESVSDALTDKDETVSSERAYMLSDTSLSVSGNGASGTRVTVAASSSVELTVTLTLTSAAKAYLDASFENGMYVEGFVKLTPIGGANGGITLNAPFLSFYGDWTQAPMFDLTFYETNPDEINDAIDDVDKLKPDAYATRPVAGFTSDYIGYMGAYYFEQNPSNVQIPAQENHMALTNTTEGLNNIYSVWAGLLRPAKTMDITITEDSTGRTIYSERKLDQRKSNSYGAGISMSAIDMGWRVSDYNLKNNTSYTVRLDGRLDYDTYGERQGGKDTNLKNSYEFTFMTDFETPKVTDVRYYTEYDETTKLTKYFADIDVYDNHYAMALRIGTWNGQTLVEEDYPTPVYGERNSTSTVTVELTDWLPYIKESYPESGKLMVFAYDYAMNASIYELSLPTDIDGIYFAENEVTVSQYETKILEPVLSPGDSFATMLEYTSANADIAKVVDGTLVGVNPGETVITVSRGGETEDGESDGENRGAVQKIRVKVLGPTDAGYRRYDKPIVKSFSLTGYHTDFAYFERFSDDRNIGETGDEVKFVRKGFSMYPGESVTLRYDLKTYFDADVIFSTNDDSVVKVDSNGKITAMGEGKGTVSIEVAGTNGLYRDSISVEVLDPYETNSGAYLVAYRGIGEDGKGNVVIPTKLNIVQISEFAFSLPKSVDKDTEPTEEDPYYTTSGPVGEERPSPYRIKSVVIPEGVEVIGRYAFAYMTSLEKVYLPSTLRQINAGAFEGCSALTTVVGLENVKIISKDAFLNCSRLNNTKRFSTPSTVEFRLDEAIGIGMGAFRGTAIQKVELPKVESAGVGAFSDCTSLTEITFGSKIKIDSSIFSGCTSLRDVSINAPVISDETFADCSSLESITLGADVAEIGARAFAGTAIAEFKLAPGNGVFTVDENHKGMLFRDGGATLAAVAPGIELSGGSLTVPNGVDRIATGAFSSLSELESVTLNDGTTVGDYAFYGCGKLKTVSGSLDHVGNYAFAGTSLSALPTIAVGASVGDYAFANILPDVGAAPSFTAVSVREGSTLGMGAFYGCNNITSVTVGKDAVVGAGAFYECTSLESVTFEAGATAVGNMAFYNCSSLSAVSGEQNIVELGEFAFGGDRRNTAPKLTSVDLSGAVSIGAGAFMNCASLGSVTVSDKLTSVGASAFAFCTSLAEIKGEVAARIGAYAFSRTALTSFAPFERAASVGSGAFANSQISGKVNLSGVGAVGAGAFLATKAESVVLKSGSSVPAYLFGGVALTEIINLETVASIGEEAFTGAQITVADLSSATYIGRLAFAESALEEVVLGEHLADMGDNPFALAPLGKFSREAVSDDQFGIPYVSYDFDISPAVTVIGGALYVRVPSGGLELVTYGASVEEGNFAVAEGTVRISDYAAAGNESLKVLDLPYSLKTIGHGAFLGCSSLGVVNFGSIEAPLLEAEYDANYAEYEEGSENPSNAAQLIGMKRSKYAAPYETNERDVLYNNNFKSYVGLTRGLTMTYPKNGKGYDAYVLDNYFDYKVVAATIADDSTRRVIALIDALPRNISLADEDQVVAARLAYNQIADAEQAALITNLETLTRAERTISALKDMVTPTPPDDTEKPTEPERGVSGGMIALIVIVVVLAAGCIAIAVIWQLPNIKKLIAAIKAKAGSKREKSSEKPEESENGENKTEGSSATDSSEEE